MQLLKTLTLSGAGLFLMLNLMAQRVTVIEPVNHSSRISLANHAKVPGKGLSLLAAPFALMDPIESSANIQLMYAPNEKLAYGVEVGYIYHYPEAQDEVNGWRFRPEVRFKNILNTGRYNAPAYFSIQGMLKFTRQPYEYEAEVVVSPSLSYFQSHSTKLQRWVSGLNLILGKETYLLGSEHLIIDAYAGLGFRYRVVNYADGASKDVITTFNNRNNRNAFSFTKFRDENGAGLSILLGLRIGWKF